METKKYYHKEKFNYKQFVNSVLRRKNNLKFFCLKKSLYICIFKFSH